MDNADDDDDGLVEVVVEIPSSPDLSVHPVTDAEAARYLFLEHICHYMAPSLIGLSNRCAVEICIFVKVGTAIKDLKSMKIADMEVLFLNKYVPLVHSIPSDMFLGNSVHKYMIDKYQRAKKSNTGQSLLHLHK
jgi:hypothetical protein